MYVSLLNNSLTDGVIIVAQATGELSTGAPIISIDPLTSKPTYASVNATNYQSALDTMNYLLKLGYLRTSFISGRAELERSSHPPIRCKPSS